MTKENILITGAFGLLGSSLIGKIDKKKYKIFCTSKKKPSPKKNNINIIYCNLSRPISKKILPNKISVIVHLAQFNQSEKKNNLKKLFYTNTGSTWQLLKYGVKAGAKHFIFASTGGVYSKKLGYSNECEKISDKKSHNFYIASKKISENLIGCFKKNLKCLILRPFFIYGKKQKDNRLIPKILSKIRKGHPIKISGKNGFYLNPIHVDDAAEAIKEAIRIKMTGIVNLAGNDQVSLKDLSLLLGKKLNIKPIFKKIQKRQCNYLGCNKKMLNYLHKPKHNIYQYKLI